LISAPPRSAPKDAVAVGIAQLHLRVVAGRERRGQRNVASDPPGAGAAVLLVSGEY